MIKRITYAALAAALVLVIGRYQAYAQSTRQQRHVDALPSVGLTAGQTLRVSFVNTGADPLTFGPCIHDADGVIVKQQSLTLLGGQTRWIDISRAELSMRDERRTQLRVGVILTGATDTKSLMASGEVIDELSGKTTAFVPPGAVFEGWTNNHNETMLSDDQGLQ